MQYFFNVPKNVIFNNPVNNSQNIEDSEVYRNFKQGFENLRTIPEFKNITVEKPIDKGNSYILTVSI